MGRTGTPLLHSAKKKKCIFSRYSPLKKMYWLGKEKKKPIACVETSFDCSIQYY